jgi:hypothetical protein
MKEDAAKQAEEEQYEDYVEPEPAAAPPKLVARGTPIASSIPSDVFSSSPDDDQGSGETAGAKKARRQAEIEELQRRLEGGEETAGGRGSRTRRMQAVGFGSKSQGGDA